MELENSYCTHGSALGCLLMYLHVGLCGCVFSPHKERVKYNQGDDMIRFARSCSSSEYFSYFVTK